MSYRDAPDEEGWAERPLSFAPLLAMLRAYWQLILACLLACAFAAASLAIAVPKYEATGFYYTPEWTLAEYKRFKIEFGSADALGLYFSSAAKGETTAAALLMARSHDRRFWEDSIRPLHPITKKDAREVFETAKDKEASGIIGLNLVLTGRDPASSRDAIVTLGEYLTDSLLLTTLQSWISNGQATSNSDLLKAENQVLQTRYSIEQTLKRADEVRVLQTKYPEAQRLETRQVVSADAASARYLAPISQVIALESSAAEMNEGLRRMERRERQLKLEAAFFDKAASISRSVVRGKSLLDELAAARTALFAGTDLSDDSVREVANRFALDLKAFRDQFSIGFGFRSPVLEPSRSSRSAALFAVAGALFGGLVGTLAAALLYWLRRSRSEVSAESMSGRAVMAGGD